MIMLYVNSPLYIVNKDGQMKRGGEGVNEVEPMGWTLGELDNRVRQIGTG